MERYEALIVDFGGVLTTPLQEAMARFALEEGIDFGDLVRAALGAYLGAEDELVVDFETGRISEDEFSHEFATRLSELAGRPIAAEGLVRRLFNVRLEEEMLGAVKAVRGAGLKTGLVSNSWGVSLYPRARFADLFDVVLISGEVGLRKPDPAIFRLAAKRLGVSAESCVFVDDEPGHLKAALNEGMRTILHRGPNETIRELQEIVGVSFGS
jgi:putative hydrolase of the HAD superfamily